MKYAFSAWLYLHNDCLNHLWRGALFFRCGLSFPLTILNSANSTVSFESELHRAFSADQYDHKFIEE